MRRRVDLGDNGSDDSLGDAMRDLERQFGDRREAAQGEPSEEEGEGRGPKSREDIQEAVEEIGRERREAAARRPARVGGSRARWIVLAVALAAAIVAGVVKMRPEPLPPAAASAEEAVEGFWRALIEGKYEAATVYYPALASRYGSRKQASYYLRDLFGENPPIEITAMGGAEELPDSGDLRVSYEVCLRNGRPRTGEFIVRYTGGPATGYVIVAAP